MKLLKSRSPYIYFYLAAVIISMEMFSIQCQERKENTKRKHKIIMVVGRFVVFNNYNYNYESISDSILRPHTVASGASPSLRTLPILTGIVCSQNFYIC